VVAACDLLPGSSSVVAWAWLLAGLLRSSLFLVHTVESPLRAEEERMEGSYAVMQERLREKLENELLSALPARAGERVPGIGPEGGCRCVVLTGSPPEELIRFAGGARAGLVVVGVRQRTLLGKLLTGSTTEAVIRTAHCHVLAVPEHGPSASGVPGGPRHA
jgi:nucleotide-binding universal stress UspA family protein